MCILHIYCPEQVLVTRIALWVLGSVGSAPSTPSIASSRALRLCLVSERRPVNNIGNFQLVGYTCCRLSCFAALTRGAVPRKSS